MYLNASNIDSVVQKRNDANPHSRLDGVDDDNDDEEEQDAAAAEQIAARERVLVRVQTESRSS